MTDLDDEHWMFVALEEAKKGYDEGEVPIGAVLVLDGALIAKEHNRVEQMQDASAHAEMLCLRQGAAALGGWRLNGAILYSTLEPCSMCAGAAFLFRVKKIVYGAPDLRHGADGSVFCVLNQPHPIHAIAVKKGVHACLCREIIQQFFRERRNNEAD